MYCGEKKEEKKKSGFEEEVHCVKRNGLVNWD